MRIALSWLAVSAIAAACAAGCSRSDRTAAGDPAAAVATVSVAELDRMLAAGECQAVDANEKPTRQRMGVIPGAVLLRELDAVDQLPADRSRDLVFYCANTACGASHEAAAKAIAAGYRKVSVLPEGIAGWVKAGKRTASL